MTINLPQPVPPIIQKAIDSFEDEKDREAIKKALLECTRTYSVDENNMYYRYHVTAPKFSKILLKYDHKVSATTIRDYRREVWEPTIINNN